MQPHSEALLRRRQQTVGQHAPLFYDQPLHVSHAENVWLYDHSGRQYLDCYNNVPHVGHCHPHVVNAMSQQAARLNIHSRYLHENVVEYVERLTSTFGPELNAMMLTCSGSEANEQALRMARFMTGKQGIIVTNSAYHGNTEAVSELGTGFMPDACTSKRVKSFQAPDSYRGLNGLTGEQLTAAYVQQIEAAIAEFEAEGTGFAGLLVCPDFANEGLLAPPPGFLAAAAQAVRKAGGLLIFDEVQAGFGRSGSAMWAHQQHQVEPDIVTLGKPMGNGFPLAGLVSSLDNVNAFTAHSMYFNTFAGTPLACAVGMAVLDVLEQEQLPENAIRTGAIVTQGLKQLQQRHSLIGEVRDLGMFFGVELVTERDSKTPATAAARRLINDMRQRGVLISTIGPHNSVLKIRPPMPFQSAHADQLLETLDQAFTHLTPELQP